MQEQATLVDLENLEQMQEIVDGYNKVMQVAWKEYVKGDDIFLLHATMEKMDLDNKKMLSTSLYSPGVLTETFININKGYIVRPNNIKAATSRNIFSNTEGLKQELILEAPESVKQRRMENQNKDEYTSEIIVSDYDIVGYLCYDEPSEEIKKQLEEKGIPIKTVKDGKLINWDERDVERTNAEAEVSLKPDEQEITENNSATKIEDVTDIPAKNEEEDIWINRFQNWNSAVDRASPNLKQYFLKMKLDITKAIKDWVKGRDKSISKNINDQERE